MTVANLGVSIAQSNKKVLIIDANLRNPSIHTIFKCQNTDGLSTVLKGEHHFNEAVQFTGISGLDVLTSGPIPINLSGILGSNKMQELILSTSNCYDVILVDTASILESSETRIMARICNGVILVINKGKTLKEKIIETKKNLDFSNTSLIGVILNDNKTR